MAEQLADCALQLAPVHDRVYHAVFEEKLCSVESFGEVLAKCLLDAARAGKAYDRAARYFERVVNLYPFDYDSSLSLAWAYFSLGKKTEARALYAKVLLIRPGDATATTGLKRL